MQEFMYAVPEDNQKMVIGGESPDGIMWIWKQIFWTDFKKKLLMVFGCDR